MIGIYKITSPNERVYIGQSIDLIKRINEYKKLRNCKKQTILYRSFLKYGVENHNFEIIEECDISMLNIKERFWQDHYDVLLSGLNCILTKTDSVRGIISEETRAKMVVNGKGKNKGRKLTEEQVQRLRILHTGREPHNKGINTFYAHICRLCSVEFKTRNPSSKLCSLKCRDENNRIKNAERKKPKITKPKYIPKAWNKGIRVKPQEHGTVREYEYYKCRCEVCSEFIKTHRKQNRIKYKNNQN